MLIKDADLFDLHALSADELHALSDAELLELEALYAERENDILRAQLKTITEYTNPNYNFLFTSLKEQLYENNKLVQGRRGAILEGSSRSGKTWSGIDIIIYICLYVETGCTINIVRETFASFSDTLYDDFRRRLDDLFLPNPFHKAKIVKSFKINGNTIKFLGADKIGKVHGAGCDYLFFNEMIHVPEAVFNQLEMRCRKFWWGDYNPSVTQHYVFDKIITRRDIGFLRTTFKDNRHISPGELNKILGYEPYLPGSYEVIENELFCVNKITGKLEPVTDANQPPPHPLNVPQGTADEFMWKVYGLGLRGAMTGIIYKNVRYIDAFPADLDYIIGNDFGFTADPNATVKYSETENEIFVELLIYHCIETPETLSNTFEAVGIDRSRIIICDSADKYTGENKGTVEMVEGLYDLNWNASKVSKTKGNMFWITSIRGKRVNIVKNHLVHHAKKEAENYRFKEINGIAINQPEDKFNHFWDAVKYAHIKWNDPDYEILY